MERRSGVLIAVVSFLPPAAHEALSRMPARGKRPQAFRNARRALNNAVVLGREERRQGRLCGREPGPFGSATWSLFPPRPAWQGCGGGCKRPLVPAGGGQAIPHAPLARVVPRLMRVSRLRAAVRCLSQALFLAVPR